MADPLPNCIYILAGVNGSGKSSILGAMVLEAGADFYNPDAVARELRSMDDDLDEDEANSLAWQQGVRLLIRAIEGGLTFVIETTLGGQTIPRLLQEASRGGREVRVWYVGLEGIDLHVARVRERVEKGGHSIPEEVIRRRYNSSRTNLVSLLPYLTELRLLDNTQDANPASGVAPVPALVVHVLSKHVLFHMPLEAIPDWAKPIAAAALELESGASRDDA